MKFLAIALLFSVSVSVFADDQEKPFEEVKQHRLSNIDKRIGFLNELKSCVSAATDHAGMKACKEKHKAEMKALKGENQGWREGMKQKRQQRKASKK